LALHFSLKGVILVPKRITMETIIFNGLTLDQFFAKMREIIKEELKQDQLLNREGALKIAGISNATFLKAINEGIVKPQIVKGRTRAMYFESEVLKIEKGRRKTG
jgi:hypothetical protein